VLAFVYGVVKMISNAANEEAQSQGRTFILWGIIGFFVIVSVYALVGVIRRTFGFGFNAKDDSTPYLQLKDKVQNLK
jgi:bacteriorhodopsin